MLLVEGSVCSLELAARGWHLGAGVNFFASERDNGTQ